MEFKFENPYAFFLIIGVLMLGVLYLMGSRKKIKLLQLITSHVSQLSLKSAHILAALFFSALFLLIVAWANPQWGTTTNKISKKSTDVLVALDVSKSMLATDQSPNRLEEAKRFAKDLLLAIRSERIGNILFAGEAYLQMPLSTDYSASQLFLSSAGTNMISAQGTALSEVMVLADSTFGNKNRSQKVLIIITDGEDHEQDAVKQAKNLSDKNVVIYTIGVGSEDGAAILDLGQGSGYLKDKEGNIVQSRLNSQLLKDIAQTANGGYFHINQSDKVFSVIKDHLSRMEKTREGEFTFDVSRSFYQFFLFLAILLLFIEYGLRLIWTGI